MSNIGVFQLVYANCLFAYTGLLTAVFGMTLTCLFSLLLCRICQKMIVQSIPCLFKNILAKYYT